METDTIAAISTPMGEGAIAIVRMSGPESIQIASTIFFGEDLSMVPSHTIHYGKIIDPQTNEVAEEVMVTVLKAPKTYTCEDVVEINCHGGMVAVNRVLDIVLRKDVRIAEPGEFSKRAFLNGRVDLSQAEAVMDLIRSKTDQAMNVALNQLDGRLSQLIKQLRQNLLETVAHVEVNIDYPEYDDVEEMSHELIQEKINSVYNEINKLLSVAEQGKILREGVATGIIGRPNVGKSSLMNTLVQESKAIVTEVPGTTRDVIEEYVNVKGVPLRLVDTAGIRETEDLVEKIGVERSRKVLMESDLILFMLNYNEELSTEDLKLFDALKGLDYIVIINKGDLARKLDIDQVHKLVGDHPVITVSLTGLKGIDELEQTIADKFYSGGVETKDLTFVSNMRHIQLLNKAKTALEDALESLELGMPLDIIQIDITRTWEFLGEIIGDTASDGLIDQLFSQFCLGK